MNVSKEWLEKKIKELNDWILEHDNRYVVLYRNTIEYKYKTRSRNYYVNKLIELEEKQMETIKV